MSDYCTTAQIAYFAQEFGALGASGQNSLVTAASRLFDNLCEVDADFFAAVTGSTSNKTFYGDGTAYLRLPPYTTLGAGTPIAVVDNGDVAMTLPEYREQNGYLVIRGYGTGVPMRDYNYSVNSPWPSDRVFNYPNATNFSGWPINYKITVTANWGFATIPADVTQATIQLAIHLWRTGDAAFTAISQSEKGSTEAIPLQAAEIAAKYREKYSKEAVFA